MEHKETSRRLVLRSLFRIMVIAALLLGIYPFISSLLPAGGAADKSPLKIDTSNLTPGELYEYEDTKGNSIWLYYRTAKEIASLNTSKPQPTSPRVLSHHNLTIDFSDYYRSQDKRFFVFSTRKRNNIVYLRHDLSYYPCGNMQYIQKSIICSKGSPNNLSSHPHVFNTAGFSNNPLVPPLTVPDHVVTATSIIVTTP